MFIVHGMYVPVERAFLCGSVLTVRAREWSLSSVGPHVSVEVSHAGQHTKTNQTRGRSQRVEFGSSNACQTLRRGLFAGRLWC